MVKIYSLENPLTGEIRYVGKTIEQYLSSRLRDHIKNCFSYNNKNSNWIRSLLKDGVKPTITLIEEVSFSEWQKEEIFYIMYLKFLGFKLNNTRIGGGGDYPINGKKWSKETRIKLIKAFSKPRINRENFGIKKKRPIEQYTKESVFIKEYLSALDAYNETGIWKESIRNCMNGRSKTAGGFIWKYKL